MLKKIITAIVASLIVTVGGLWAGTINVPGDHTTIQAAVTAANPGDLIQVAAGSYNENVTIDKSVTINGVAGTVLDGTGVGGNGFLFKASDITIDGFEITNFVCGIRTYGGPSTYNNINVNSQINI